MSYFDDMWNGLKEGLNNGLEQVQQIGVPVIKASIEQAGIDWLKKQNEETQSQVTSAIKSLSTQPNSPIGQAVATTIQKSVLELYGPHIFIGVLVLVGIGYSLKGK